MEELIIQNLNKFDEKSEQDDVSSFDSSSIESN